MNVSEGDEDDLVAALARRLGHRFGDRELALTALSHPSYAHEVRGDRGNERLEFLGDAVIDLVVSEALYGAHPDWNEGELSRARASLVRREGLARRAREIGLPALVRLGSTERRSGGAEKDSILANTYEAVVGALYLDAGLGPVEALVASWLAGSEGELALGRDAKTEFQEWAHAALRDTPKYHTVGDSEVEDDDLRFTVEVRVADAAWGTGVGRTKQSAEQAAARAALARRSDAT